MKPVRVTAPANIAFIKYWGNTDDNLPLNPSISMTLDKCISTTTALLNHEKDSINLKSSDGSYNKLSTADIKGKKAFEHLERIRILAGRKEYVSIESENSFPSNAGIASSASGFAALTAAAVLAYGMHDLFEDKKELSKLVRQSGSGSAARSVYGGFVELTSGKTTDDSYALQLADDNHWELCDVIAVVNHGSKKTPSSEGHRSAHSSPYLNTRLDEMKKRVDLVREAISEKDLEKLGLATEQDTISMHAIMMTSVPPLYYFEPGTIEIIKSVIEWREEGLESYFSIDAGANVHVICERKNADKIHQKVSQIGSVHSIITNKPAQGISILSR